MRFGVCNEVQSKNLVPPKKIHTFYCKKINKKLFFTIIKNMLPLFAIGAQFSQDSITSISVPSYMIIAQIENEISSAPRMPYLASFGEKAPPPQHFSKI